MKSLVEYINEALNKDAMFMGATSKRTDDNFKFTEGEKALLIKYDTHGYAVQLRGIVNIDKVNKKSIVISSDNADYDDFYKGLKFNNYGICVVKNKNKYLGNSTQYWVLYNKELIDDKDITELLEKGNNTWGFKFHHVNKDEYIKDLKKYIKEIQ